MSYQSSRMEQMLSEHFAQQSAGSNGYFLSQIGISSSSELFMWVWKFAGVVICCYLAYLIYQKVQKIKQEKIAKERKEQQPQQSQQFSASERAVLAKLAKALDKQ